MMTMTTKRTIRLTIDLIVEDYCAGRRAAERHWEEHNCVGNQFEAIAERMREAVCNECAFSEVKLLPDGTPGLDLTGKP